MVKLVLLNSTSANLKNSRSLSSGAQHYHRGMSEKISHGVAMNRDPNSSPSPHISSITHHMWMFYKPVSVDTDMSLGSDMCEMIPKDLRKRTHHIGRLDRDTSGLILLSEDGSLTKRILTSGALPKTYLARVSVCPSELQLDRLTQGLVLGDGAAVCVSAERVNYGDRATVPLFLCPLVRGVESEYFFVRVVTCEGRNRIVRRMLAAVGLPVLGLHREKVGNLCLRPDMWPGTVSKLDISEVDTLVSLVS